jgi:hypothetical protein
VLENVPGLEVHNSGGRSGLWYVTKAVPSLVADSTDHSRPVRAPDDLPDVAHLIHSYDIALVVIDVLMVYLDGKANSFKDQDVRRCSHGLPPSRTGPARPSCSSDTSIGPAGRTRSTEVKGPSASSAR